MGKKRKLLRISSLRKPDQRQELQPNFPCRFHSLPQVLVTHILSSLCFKTVAICRCVCKAWLSITSAPNFAHLHYSKSIGTLGFLSQGLNVTYIKEACAASDKYIELTFEDMLRERFPTSFYSQFINSCNGFICLQGNQGRSIIGEKSFYVCNPVTGEFITIPLPKEKYIGSDAFVGLGFSAVTNEYKVLQTSTSVYDQEEKEAEIYTIGSRGVWRSIGKAPVQPVELPTNSYLHGALHWAPSLSIFSSTGECIHSFDFEKEKFRRLPLPSCLVHVEESWSYGEKAWRLGVLQGCLFLGVPGEDHYNECDVWVMKDYGVQESWTKVFVIKNLLLDTLCRPYFEPLMFLSDGSILISYCNEVLISYNQETESYLKIEGYLGRITAYHPSFVSLCTVSNGADVERYYF
ncbi:F-box protein At3g07870-like [Rosa rugosa]|uniref:F-box protein At3g07870-like n=1 Tax=Rosa rugosa TaxID=74645 RepID=UPI002B40C384|nr:F-box protein At3g07870-like [Rosa rugosa]